MQERRISSALAMELLFPVLNHGIELYVGVLVL